MEQDWESPQFTAADKTSKLTLELVDWVHCRNGYQYKGPLKNGKAHGMGEQRWENENNPMLKGSMRANRYTGAYTGEFYNGLRATTTAIKSPVTTHVKCLRDRDGALTFTDDQGQPLTIPELSNVVSCPEDFTIEFKQAVGTVYTSKGPITYKGGLMEGEPDGTGKLSKPAYSYDGGFTKGVRQGKGTYEDQEIHYVGSFESNHLKTGALKYLRGSDKPGVTYTGSFNDDNTIVLWHCTRTRYILYTCTSFFKKRSKDYCKFEGKGTMTAPQGGDLNKILTNIKLEQGQKITKATGTAKNRTSP